MSGTLPEAPCCLPRTPKSNDGADYFRSIDLPLGYFPVEDCVFAHSSTTEIDRWRGGDRVPGSRGYIHLRRRFVDCLGHVAHSPQ